MTPLVVNTQITGPTQVPLVATTLPGTSVLRAPLDAISPMVPDPKIGPDAKGNGIYTARPAAQAVSAPSTLSPLSFLVPASFSTNSASLSVNTMFAAQSLAQEGSVANEYLPVYEELAAASQVKYKPSDATLPEPAPNNLFAKMLAEEQQVASSAAVMHNAPHQEAPQAATATKAPAPAPKKSSNDNEQNISASARSSAASAYSATTVRNAQWLDAPPPVEAVAG